MARTTAGRRSDNNPFSQVPRADIPRSVFNRSHSVKTTFDSGLLIPIFVDEALPGDTLNLRMNTFTRMTTPKTPVMDNLYMDFFFFAVPNRLLWSNWERMNGAQDTPGASTDFLVPVVDAPDGNGWGEQSLGDYMGIPTKVTGIQTSALFFRAYNLIWNTWFRSQDLQDPVNVPLGDGPDDPDDYSPLRRGKRHDYFTSCLPFPQKGEAVQIPAPEMALQGSLTGNGYPQFELGTTGNFQALQVRQNEDIVRKLGSQETTDEALRWYNPALSLASVTTDPDSVIQGMTINELREAFQVQRLFERDARGGTRYTEILRSHFGVTSPDARLQRPEYLGGGSVPINVNPVANTAVNPGTLGAFVTSSSTGDGFNKSFTEHCVLIGLACVRADLHYQQGHDRQFLRRSRFDFYWPAFAHLGEQAVPALEIFQDGNTVNDEAIFGYQERYAEYRYKPSKVTGIMRSNASTSLDVWHLAQDFDDHPVLNEVFIQEDPPVDRVVVVPSEPQFLFDAFFNYRCARPMPTFSVPGMADHF